MSAKLLEAQTEPIVGLDEIKRFARVSHDDDDFLLEGLIKTATAWVEEATGKSLLKKKWSYSHNNNVLSLPHGPVLKVLEVNYGRRTLDAKDYTLRQEKNTTVVEVPFSWNRRKVTVIYTAGFGDKADDVPSTLKQAVMSTVTYIYENRYPVPGNAHTAVSSTSNQAAFEPWIAYHRSYQLA